MEVCISWSISLVRYSVFDVRHLSIQQDQGHHRHFSLLALIKNPPNTFHKLTIVRKLVRSWNIQGDPRQYCCTSTGWSETRAFHEGYTYNILLRCRLNLY